MARKRKNKSKGKSRKGKKSLGKLGLTPTSASMAVALGGGATAAALLGIRQFVQPTSDITRKVTKHAPLVSVGVGLIPAAMAYRSGRKDLGMATGLSAALVGGTIFATQHQSSSVTAAADSVAGVRGLRGRALGAIVPQYSLSGGRRSGMGAIMMEQLRGNDQGQGAVINLRGQGGLGALTGAVDVGAFGTSSY